MLAALLGLAVAAGACGWLGSWQLDRAFERKRIADDMAAAQQLASGPQPLSQVLAPQSGLAAKLIGTWVVVTGTFDGAQQVRVTGREVNVAAGGSGEHGSGAGGETKVDMVLAPLLVKQDDGTIAHLAVLRGWIPVGAPLPPAPSGAVQVVGYLAPAEASGNMKAGATDTISPAQLVNVWGGSIYSAHLVQSAGEGVLALAPRPRIPQAGLNLQNLLYAGEWWLFGGFALALWVRMVRDNAADARVASPDQPAGEDA